MRGRGAAHLFTAENRLEGNRDVNGAGQDFSRWVRCWIRLVRRNRTRTGTASDTIGGDVFNVVAPGTPRMP
jgi:hypothetical protein